MGNSLKNQFEINLVSIKKNTETFDYLIDNTLFENFDQEIVKKGNVNVHLDLTKTDLMVTMKFIISGNVNLTCDKSLEEFDEELNSTNTIYFKYGDENIELDVNLFQIDNKTVKIDVYSHIMELILLEVPFRKIHPNLRDEDEKSEEGEILYQTDPDQDIEKENTDPRWDDLEKLKNKFNK